MSPVKWYLLSRRYGSTIGLTTRKVNPKYACPFSETIWSCLPQAKGPSASDGWHEMSCDPVHRTRRLNWTRLSALAILLIPSDTDDHIPASHKSRDPRTRNLKIPIQPALSLHVIINRMNLPAPDPLGTSVNTLSYTHSRVSGVRTSRFRRFGVIRKRRRKPGLALPTFGAGDTLTTYISSILRFCR